MKISPAIIWTEKNEKIKSKKHTHTHTHLEVEIAIVECEVKLIKNLK